MRALADLDVLIVDCQTTGASPAFGCVLELGWGVTRASCAELTAAEAHWIALPEGQSVPRQIQKITGYEPAHAKQAVPDSDAWARLRRAVQRSAAAPTAIHYARFELAFLRDWSARFEPQIPFPFDAVCVHADLWTPDEAVFAAGWTELVARHPAEFLLCAVNPRQGALRLAKRLLLSAPRKAVEELESNPKPEGWDPERVARHIERALAQAYQAYRRARWLRRLHDCDVVYREPTETLARLLLIREGALAQASDVPPRWVPTHCVRAEAEPHALPAFDRAKYDRLRVLTSELKRIARDGGDVAVHFGPSSSIPQHWLKGLLRLV